MTIFRGLVGNFGSSTVQPQASKLTSHICIRAGVEKHVLYVPFSISRAETKPQSIASESRIAARIGRVFHFLTLLAKMLVYAIQVPRWRLHLRFCHRGGH